LPSNPAVAWRRPAALRQGDLVGVCAPAGAVDPERLERGVAALQELGFAVRVAPASTAQHQFKAGFPEERLRDLHDLLKDDAVRAVFCARGGAGAAALLPQLEVRGLTPKIFVGYSDITFLQLALQRVGWVTFQGPMVAWELAGGLVEPTTFGACLQSGLPLVVEGDPLVPLRAGHGEGRLLGGCLSILAAAAGTPWALRPDPEGTVLFLEDVAEAPYRIDRQLFQLRASGAFDAVRAIVFGEMKGCRPAAAAGYTLEEVVLEALAGLHVPIAFGLAAGHTTGPNLTLPLGVRARVSCGAGARIETLERSLS
jgi:muramoyltetrapeptide carboxypeptidase